MEQMMTSPLTSGAAGAVTAAAPRSAWREYSESWKRVPGSAVYLIAGFVVAIVGLGILAALFSAGVGMIVLVIGLPVIWLSLVVARGFGTADRWLLRLTGLPEIAEPEWNRDRPGTTGFWAALTRPMRNGHYWTHLVHGVLVNPIVSTVTFSLAVTWIAVSLGGLTYWFWGMFTDDAQWGSVVAAAIPWLFGGWTDWAVKVVLYLVAGVIFTITLPWVLGGLARAHHAIATGILGRWHSDDLTVEVRAESEARAAAVQAENVSLRRLERDIHDGPQQRLVRLQMDLAALERRAAGGDTDAAAELAREAQLHAKSALDELRALSSGVAPPLLQDRGLAAALTAVASASALAVNVEVDPEVDSVGPEIARTVYFVVAELLTNTVKHAGASRVTLKAAIRPADAAAAGAGQRMLDVWVVDNGRGGAHLTPGHGLEGLRDRVHGLRGTLMVESPIGGPTSMGVHIPLAGAPATA